MCRTGLESLVAAPVPDGYWIHSFPYSKSSEYPDLMAYGLGFENVPESITRFINPKNDPQGSNGWRVTEIQRLQYPIGMGFADLNDDDYNDIVIIDRFGTGSSSNLWDATKGGGRIQWLRNPGNITDPAIWEARYIGNSTGMHRLVAFPFGHFSDRENFQVMGLPILAATNDLVSPAPVLVYSPSYGPNRTDGPESWSEENVFPTQFRVIHDSKIVTGENGLDMVLVSGLEGVVLLWFDEKTSKWEYNIVNPGLPPDPSSPYHGAGSVDVASVGDDSVGYIVAAEGFHGNVVSVYVKNSTGVKGPESLKQNVWRRIQIDSFGPVDNVTNTGTIHNVHTVKSANNQSDSFGIACIGSRKFPLPENQGVYVYSPIDLAKGRFTKSKITDRSAARLAVDTFVDKDRLDVASMSYAVPGFPINIEPPNVRINTIGNPVNNGCPVTVVSGPNTTSLNVVFQEPLSFRHGTSI
ncbi:hypothetical protein C8J56DRAFT_798543 [Mycena floridula]|nr:hypothetical protein C8J56DRAFT_798543 [Mycena floridula]